MKQTKLRIPTLLLAVWMLIAAIPITAFAELLQLQTEPMPTDSTVYVLAEDNTKRTAFEKHYYCSDGTFVAVTYPEAVHYQDEQGEWVDVDLRMTNDSAAQAYRSQSGSFKTSFSKPGGRSDASMMSTGNMSAVLPAVSMESGEYALSWTLAGEQPAGAVAGTYAANASGSSSCVLSASEQATVQVMGELKTATPAMAVQKLPVTDPDAFALPSVANQVIYEDIFGEDQNVSVRYSVSLNKIEEDILITAPTEMTSFSMQIECAGLTPVLNDDNSVDFLDNDGNMVYHVSSPYLADAAFAVSYEVGVTLTEQNGTCTVTYTPDAEWMNDPARVYPIMLDPAVTTNDYTSAIMDTYVVEGNSSGFYTSQYLYFNPMNGNNRIAVFRIQAFPEIDASMPIISAKIHVKSTSTQTTSSQVTLSTVQDGFNVLMGNYSALTPYMIDSKTLATASLGMYMEFDISQSISEIYAGTIGKTFALRCNTDGRSAIVFPIHSMESTDLAARPYMTVTYGYTLPTGLAANDQINVQNLGSGGYLYPNSGLPGAGNYVMHAPSSAALALRTFVLRGNTANGTYKLEMTPYSDTSNVFVSANVTSKLVLLKNASEVSATVQQDWLIVPYGATTFKIVLASDMRYVLTAVGTASTYAATPSTTTAGCVSITQCNGTPTDAQLWKIYKGGSCIRNSTPSVSIDNGTYFINHHSSRKFLRYINDQVQVTRGRVGVLGKTVSWRIYRLPDGHYVLQCAADTTRFLADSTAGPIMTAYNNTYSIAQKWLISNSTAGYLFTNASTGKTLKIATEPGATWDLIQCTDYVELDDSISFNDLTIAVGGTGQVQTYMPIAANTTYASLPGDFIYTSSNPSIATVNTFTGEVSGNSRGEAEIEVIHKATGFIRTFSVTVEKRAIIIVPGFGGSVLQMGISSPHYNDIANKDVLSLTRLKMIEMGGEKAVRDVNTLLGSLEKGEIVSGVFNFIQQFTNDSINFVYNDAVESLMLPFTMTCDELGNSIYDIVPKPFDDSEPYNDDKFGFGNTYEKLYSNLVRATQESDSRYKGYEVTIYTYDWRLSCSIAATNLNSFINNKQYDKVVLVCHSTGGIVGSAYVAIGTEQQNKVERYFSYGTPHLGTTVAPIVCLTGDINLFYNLFCFESEILNTLAKELIRTVIVKYLLSDFPCVYELFPTRKFFNSNPGYIYEIDNGSVDLVCYDYIDTIGFISTHMKGFNQYLMEKAEILHEQVLNRPYHITYDIDSIYVYGENYETPVSISHDCNNIIASLCNAQYGLTMGAVGDTIVHGRSATVGGLTNQRRFYKVQETHMSMIEMDYDDFIDIMKYQEGDLS